MSRRGNTIPAFLCEAGAPTTEARETLRSTALRSDLIPILPEREFSEENQEAAMKRESELLFRIHLLVSVFAFSPRLP
jgi:hypothetical protein